MRPCIRLVLAAVILSASWVGAEGDDSQARKEELNRKVTEHRKLAAQFLATAKNEGLPMAERMKAVKEARRHAELARKYMSELRVLKGAAPSGKAAEKKEEVPPEVLKLRDQAKKYAVLAAQFKEKALAGPTGERRQNQATADMYERLARRYADKADDLMKKLRGEKGDVPPHVRELLDKAATYEKRAASYRESAGKAKEENRRRSDLAMAAMYDRLAARYKKMAEEALKNPAPAVPKGEDQTEKKAPGDGAAAERKRSIEHYRNLVKKHHAAAQHFRDLAAQHAARLRNRKLPYSSRKQALENYRACIEQAKRNIHLARNYLAKQRELENRR